MPSTPDSTDCPTSKLQVFVSTKRTRQCYDRRVDLPRQTRIITSLNRKGGVGKTHLCWLIASVCEERGKRCLVVDLDPQANITSSLSSPDDGRATIEVLFDPTSDPNANHLVRRTAFEHIDVIPGSLRLEAFNISEQSAWEAHDLQLSLVDALRDLACRYDYVLLDCPPSLSLVSYAALCASDFVMIPMEAAHWGALGTQHVISAMAHIQEHYNSRLQLLGYVVSRYKRVRSYQQTHLTELRRHFGPAAFKTVIPDLAVFEKSVTDRIPITLHSPSSDACRIARRFFDEVEARAQSLSQSGQFGRRRCLRTKAGTSV